MKGARINFGVPNSEYVLLADDDGVAVSLKNQDTDTEYIGGGGGGGNDWKKTLYTETVNFTIGSWSKGAAYGSANLPADYCAITIKELHINEKTYTNIVFPQFNFTTQIAITDDLPIGITQPIIVVVDYNNAPIIRYSTPTLKLTFGTETTPEPTLSASAIVEGYVFNDENDELMAAYQIYNDNQN